MTFRVDVDDIATYRKKIFSAGGKVQFEEQQVPGMGAFSFFADTQERMMGIRKTAKK